MVAAYLLGILKILLAISWIISFNWAWWKVTGEKLWEENPFAAMFMPFLTPLAVIIILLFPLILGLY